jgi:hypothetical protein
MIPIDNLMKKLDGDNGLGHEQTLDMVNKIWEDFTEHTEMVINGMEYQKGELIKCIVNIMAVQKLLIEKKIITQYELEPHMKEAWEQVTTLPEINIDDDDNSLDDIKV